MELESEVKGDWNTPEPRAVCGGLRKLEKSFTIRVRGMELSRTERFRTLFVNKARGSMRVEMATYANDRGVKLTHM